MDKVQEVLNNCGLFIGDPEYGEQYNLAHAALHCWLDSKNKLPGGRIRCGQSDIIKNYIQKHSLEGYYKHY